MTDEKGLLAAIWTAPHDDTPRLVYADWLEEHGHPERAEFIRVQCELARFDRWDPPPRKAELEKREQKLWKQHGKAWRAGLPSPLKVGAFRRGFPHAPRQNVTGKQFLAFPEEKLKAAPLWSFYLGATTEAEMAGIPDTPALRQTEELSSWQTIPAFTADALARLVGSPNARNLRTLGLSNQRVGEAGADAVAGAKLPHLAGLYLGEAGLTDDGVRRLGGWPGFAGLTELGLTGNGLGDGSLDVIAATVFRPGLRTLLLGSNPDFTPDGLIRLIGSPAAASLRVLNVVGSPAVTPAFARALAASPAARSLRNLVLANTPLGDRGVAMLLDSPHLAELDFINVSGCGVHPDGPVARRLGAEFGGGGYGSTFGGWRTRRPG